ncbi:LPS export ABC transporter periplasmic protein LptC [Allosphingosinicella sp.]|jgi:lipopolysaccharide export system protein LptC|uniref:LPS export ABC transporter periplasmic protein LptC n=1 Tax=Allosphingosinicella sp. TaxID=2823234 RepID=UPI002F1B4978
MSEAVLSEAVQAGRLRTSWAAPGSFHDYLVGFLKIALPLAAGVLLAYLVLAPLSKGPEVSFLLDKSKVETASERMRIQEAQYRGQDDLGRPFLIRAQTAVQASADEPVVDIETMAAQILLESGPARIDAIRARYDMAAQLVKIAGVVRVSGADGYRLQTHDVTVNLNRRNLTSDGPVQGSMRLGRFSAGRLDADLASRTVVLSGGARLHIVQGALR